jgi:hypothetical protein
VDGDSIYNKLGVSSTTEAVTKASLLGIVTPNHVELAELGQTPGVSVSSLVESLVPHPAWKQFSPDDSQVQRMAGLGLLVFILAAMPAEKFTEPRPWQGLLLEYDSDGDLINSYDCAGRLVRPRAVAFAPPTAAGHGFTPGNLYIANLDTWPNALNCGSILEMTPLGDPVREFTGGEYMSTRLVSLPGLAFTKDGRLIAGSGAGTNALLEFTEGGSAVRRFVDLIPYGQLGTDSRGNVYAAGGLWSGCTGIHVYSGSAESVATYGAGDLYTYSGAAVDNEGTVYALNAGDKCIEVYDSGSRRRNRTAEVGRAPARLAIDGHDRLFVLDGPFEAGSEGHACRILVFDAAAFRPLADILTPHGVHVTSITVSPDDHLWATGFTC